MLHLSFLFSSFFNRTLKSATTESKLAIAYIHIMCIKKDKIDLSGFISGFRPADSCKTACRDMQPIPHSCAFKALLQAGHKVPGQTVESAGED